MLNKIDIFAFFISAIIALSIGWFAGYAAIHHDPQQEYSNDVFELLFVVAVWTNFAFINLMTLWFGGRIVYMLKTHLFHRKM